MSHDEHEHEHDETCDHDHGDPRLVAGWAALDRGELALAQEKVRELLASTPVEAESFLFAAAVAREDENEAEALTHLAAAEKADPDWGVPLLWRAEIKAGQGDLKGALKEAGRALDKVEDEEDFLSALALTASLELELERAHHENEMLISIGRALSQQRDIHSLLEIILRRAREVTGADAGSVYIVEGMALAPKERTLRFMISQNSSLDIDFREFSLPVDERSIVGRAVLSREIINIPNLYELEEEGKNPWGFRHDKSFDRKVGYQGRSMLTVPMVNQKDEVIGVIQLINRRRPGAGKLRTPADFDHFVIPFDERSEELLSTLASQAGISLENTLLYEDIRRLFDGFVHAAVTAIESRDPTTSGHSHRVARLTVGLAEMVDKESNGPFAGIHFHPDNLKEIEYAGLLHDFGKVGVREHVLVKAKKLYEHQRELILQRFELIRRGFEVEGLKKKVEYLTAADRDRVAAVDVELASRLAEIDEFVTFILTANEPTVLEQGGFERLKDIEKRTYRDIQGGERPFLLPEEVVSLSIPRGSLTQKERREIESHVTHTYHFLKRIPWSRSLRSIPEIAYGHHEKLDGKGYPNALPADSIKVQTRMMTISDIYDALTAQDRPYKRAVSSERALDILTTEVKEGQLDEALFKLFIEGKVFQRQQSEDA